LREGWITGEGLKKRNWVYSSFGKKDKDSRRD